MVIESTKTRIKTIDRNTSKYITDTGEVWEVHPHLFDNSLRVIVATGKNTEGRVIYNQRLAFIYNVEYTLPTTIPIPIMVADTVDDILDILPDDYIPSDDFLQRLTPVVLRSPILVGDNFAASLNNSYSTYGQLTEKQLMCVFYGTRYGCLARDVIQKDPGFWSRFVDHFVPRVRVNKPNKSSLSIKELCVSRVKLVPTSEFKFFSYPFEKFNPIQSVVFKKYRKKANNLVIAAATSTGKTVCAELLISNALENKKKAIYLSPLKALTAEKYEDWRKGIFKDHKVMVMTGDYRLTERRLRELREASVICMTSEMLDSRTRNYLSEKNEWLRDVGIVVADEVHIIGSESRGHACESGLMRFSRINPDARLVLLSATIPNVGDFVEWCKLLNNKETDCVKSSWRPVEIVTKIIPYNPKEYSNDRDARVSEAVKIALRKNTEKFLIFVHDKKTGRSIRRRLRANEERAEFHSADLTREKREQLEDEFRNGDLRYLISTSTLAWGVNLPAKNVIITGVYRGKSTPVDELDIIQMVGRAGRLGIDNKGYVSILVPVHRVEEWTAKLRNPSPVMSKLAEKEILAFHILGELKAEGIETIDDIYFWFSRSLSALQRGDLSEELLVDTLNDLYSLKMVTVKGSFLKLLKLGEIAANLYFSPYDIADWKSNFDFVHTEFGNNLEVVPNHVLAWAITNVRSKMLPYSYIPPELESEYKELQDTLYRSGVVVLKDRWPFVECYGLWQYLEGIRPEVLPMSVQAAFHPILFDLERITAALSLIDSCKTRWNIDWRFLYYKVLYGIDRTLMKLVTLDGVGRVRAQELYSEGISSPKDIVRKEDIVRNMFGSKVAERIIQSAKEKLGVENESTVQSV